MRILVIFVQIEAQIGCCLLFSCVVWIKSCFSSCKSPMSQNRVNFDLPKTAGDFDWCKMKGNAHSCHFVQIEAQIGCCLLFSCVVWIKSCFF
jgi:hypothetical protein